MSTVPFGPLLPARQAKTPAFALLAVAVLSACGGEPPAAPTAAGSPGLGEAVAAPPPASKGKGKAKAKVHATDAPGGRIVAQPRAMCVPSCQLLTAYTVAEVQAGYCALCGAHDDSACVMDWPSNDVPSCEIWDFYRNCIYATYGRTFEKPQWRDAFGKEPWYRLDPAYTDARLSPVAEANIKELVRRKAEKVQCMD
jgi:hypothetical protein